MILIASVLELLEFQSLQLASIRVQVDWTMHIMVVDDSDETSEKAVADRPGPRKTSAE